MITREGDVLVPIAFNDFIDPQTGRSQIRLVETDAAHYQIAREYQIRLTDHDLLNDEIVERISRVTNLSAEQVRKEFRPAVVGARTSRSIHQEVLRVENYLSLLKALRPGLFTFQPSQRLCIYEILISTGSFLIGDKIPSTD